MPSSNSRLETLLARYEVLIKTTPHIGHDGRHVLGMLPQIARFAAQVASLNGEERSAMLSKLNRWLGFAQGFLWLACGYSLDDLREETRGLDDAWLT